MLCACDLTGAQNSLVVYWSSDQLEKMRRGRALSPAAKRRSMSTMRFQMQGRRQALRFISKAALSGALVAAWPAAGLAVPPT